MATELIAVLVGSVGALLGAAIQFSFQRLSAARQERREIVEQCFLQLQNALESLYYRINNLRDWAGKRVMTDDYFRLTSVYAFGRVLAFESLLVSEGIYARLHYDKSLKTELKRGLHRINHSMDDQRFLHYHRVQLAEALLEGEKVVSYTEYLSRAQEPLVKPVIEAAAQFVETVKGPVLDEIRDAAEQLIRLLERHTQVPSALSLEREPSLSSSPP